MGERQDRITRRLRRATTIVVSVAMTGLVVIGTAEPAAAEAHVVTNLDDAGPGSLRAAIDNANDSDGDDTITFALDGTITLASELPDIGAGGLTIIGNGADATIIDGASSYRSLLNLVSGAADVAVSRLTARQGSAAAGGAINLDVAGGSLLLDRVDLVDNSADWGGAIDADGGSVVVRNSTISANSAPAAAAVWVGSSAFVTIENTVITGNSGSGIVSLEAGSLTMRNSTVVGNSSTFEGALSFYSGVAMTVLNSVVADNGDGDCDHLGPVPSISHSLVGDGSCGVVAGTDGNLTGAAALGGDLVPLATSPVIDAGDNAEVPADLTTDRAGNPRIQGLAVDMGAFEAAAVPIVDHQGPTVSVERALYQGATADGGPVTFLVTFDEAPVGFTADDLEVTGTAGATSATLSGGPTNWTVSVSAVPRPGTVLVSLPAGTVTDALGNPNLSSAAASVTLVDDVAPWFFLPTSMVASADDGPSTPVEYMASAYDPGYTTAPVVECTPPSGAAFPIGVTTVDCTASDASGNVSHGSFPVTVRDAGDPVIEQIEDLHHTLGPNETTWALEFDLPVFSDASGQAKLLCNLLPGTELGTGSHVVVCMAVDPAGNWSNTTFTVTIENRALTADERWVVDLYHDVLGRLPAERELDQWVRQLELGGSRRQIARGVLFSNEATRVWVIGGLYRRILGRAPDSAAFDPTYALHNSGAYQRLEARLFASHERYRLSGSTGRNYFAALYRDALGREGAKSEISYWVDRLERGENRVPLTRSLLNTKEAHAARVKRLLADLLPRSASPKEVADLVAMSRLAHDDRHVAAAIIAMR